MCDFNFTVNFNCAAYIPYFPAGYHHGKRGNAIVFGLETPNLLAAALLGWKSSMHPMPRRCRLLKLLHFLSKKYFLK